jgi:hypothetical protein
MGKKIKGYISLSLAIIIFVSIITNFIFTDIGSISILEKIFYGPNSMVALFLATILLGISLFYIWKISIKRIIKIVAFSSMVIALIPIVLILIHAGEL